MPCSFYEDDVGAVCLYVYSTLVEPARVSSNGEESRGGLSRPLGFVTSCCQFGPPFRTTELVTS